MELDTSSVAGFMTSRIYFEFPDRSIYIEIWLLLLILAAVVLSVVAVCLAVRANRKKKARKKIEDKLSAEDAENQAIRDMMAGAPPITAYTEAEYPCGIEPMEYAHNTDGSFEDQLKRQKAYDVWMNEQKKLYDEQIKARQEYFRTAAVKTPDASDTDDTEHPRELTTKERKQYEKIQRDNERRIARAKAELEKEKRGKKRRK